MRRDVDMLKKLKAKTFEAPSGLQMQETVKEPATSIPQTA
jgi:hypothetical protein